MKKRSRILIGIVFVLALIVCGLAAGTWIGGRYFVAPGSGLAGPAIALGYGVLGAGALGLLGAILVIYLPPRALIFGAVPVFVVGAILLVIIGRGVLISNAESEAHLQQAYENMNHFTVAITNPDGAAAPFSKFEADWAARQFVVTMSGDDAGQCAVAMTGPDAVKMLTALRDVEGIVFKTPDPCPASSEPMDYQLAFFIDEARPPDSKADIKVSASCLNKFPALAGPRKAALELVEKTDLPDTCG